MVPNTSIQVLLPQTINPITWLEQKKFKKAPSLRPIEKQIVIGQLPQNFLLTFCYWPHDIHWQPFWNWPASKAVIWLGYPPSVLRIPRVHRLNKAEDSGTRPQGWQGFRGKFSHTTLKCVASIWKNLSSSYQNRVRNNHPGEVIKPFIILVQCIHY